MNKLGVNSGVSWVTETDAGHGILLRSPISKMAAKIIENTHVVTGYSGHTQAFAKSNQNSLQVGEVCPK